VKRLHPYDEPEVVALPIQGGSASYLKWLHDSTAAPDASKLLG
jgi:periplasmic divalent cation tolerance protein